MRMVAATSGTGVERRPCSLPILGPARDDVPADGGDFLVPPQAATTGHSPVRDGWGTRLGAVARPDRLLPPTPR
jgi:hypothetical protein